MLWVLAALFVTGAIVAVLRRRRRAHREASVAVAGPRPAFAAMTWPQFAEVVGEYFRRRGFAAAETQRPSPDGAVDLELIRLDEYYLVHCKQWRATTVGVETVREFCGVMASRHAAGGFVVTSGSFSEDARKAAEGRAVELISGEQLAAGVK